MDTGLHQPIAWIDVSGKSFFPETFSHNDEPLGTEDLNHLGDDVCDPSEAEILGHNNINLNLKIEIQRTCPALEDCDDKVHICAKSSDVEVDDTTGNYQMEGNMILADKSVNRPLKSRAVIELFYKAISSCAAKIDEILPCTSVILKSRLELSEKQVEVTERYHGDANVQCAWFRCSSRSVSAILKYGFIHHNQLKNNPSLGNGYILIHLLLSKFLHRMSHK